MLLGLGWLLFYPLFGNERIVSSILSVVGDLRIASSENYG